MWRACRSPGVGEFEAWARGAPLVAEAADLELPARFLLVSVGTGTSVLHVDEVEAERIGGSALGGGTLLGLGRLLLEADGFAEIAALASQGDRREVDLLVGDIYESGVDELAAELNAASFGKLDSTDPEDLAHALAGMIGENVALIAVAHARAHDVEEVVYCGSTLEGTEPAHPGPDARHPALRAVAPIPPTGRLLRRGGSCGASLSLRLNR